VKVLAGIHDPSTIYTHNGENEIMNTYKKYCPNVFVAQCEEKHEKGDAIIVVTKYGKENECR
jgi:hypothetical protein